MSIWFIARVTGPLNNGSMSPATDTNVFPKTRAAYPCSLEILKPAFSLFDLIYAIPATAVEIARLISAKSLSVEKSLS